MTNTSGTNSVLINRDNKVIISLNIYSKISSLKKKLSTQRQ